MANPTHSSHNYAEIITQSEKHMHIQGTKQNTAYLMRGWLGAFTFAVVDIAWMPRTKTVRVSIVRICFTCQLGIGIEHIWNISM
jgi:hypothetical protein